MLYAYVHEMYSTMQDFVHSTCRYNWQVEWVTYLNVFHLLPWQKITQLIGDLCQGELFVRLVRLNLYKIIKSKSSYDLVPIIRPHTHKLKHVLAAFAKCPTVLSLNLVLSVPLNNKSVLCCIFQIFLMVIISNFST